jgi:hypothetical protein
MELVVAQQRACRGLSTRGYCYPFFYAVTLDCSAPARVESVHSLRILSHRQFLIKLEQNEQIEFAREAWSGLYSLFIAEIQLGNSGVKSLFNSRTS